MSQAIRVPYKAVNGVSIPTDIHFKPSAISHFDRKKAPVLLIFHGGGFAVGEASMNSSDQIEDCLDRGWIVLSAEYRLCPGVTALDGPVKDARDLLDWSQNGGLEAILQNVPSCIIPDTERVMAMGTSAGGHLALSLAWNVSKPPFAILDFYGAKNFGDPFWTSSIPQIKSKLPKDIPCGLREQVAQEATVFSGGMSLEGQANSNQAGPPRPNFSDPRVLYLFSCIANGRMLELMGVNDRQAIEAIDPYLNVHTSWPPTAIVHGTADFMVPTELSRQMHARLKQHNVTTVLIEVQGEPHTFVGTMKKGSETWTQQRKGFDFLEDLLSRA